MNKLHVNHDIIISTADMHKKEKKIQGTSWGK